MTIENIELKTNLDNSQLLNEQIKDLRNHLNNIVLTGDADRVKNLEKMK